jgi:CRISPR-associated protein Cas6
MRLRIPGKRLQDAQALSGQSLDIEGHALQVGAADVSLLSSLPTLFSRYVLTYEQLDETQFLEEAAGQLKAMDIPCRKMLAGITHTMKFPGGPVFTRSLMVAELTPEQSVRLQQVGLGEGRTFGCGLFLPHKGIRPVKEPDGE